MAKRKVVKRKKPKVRKLKEIAVPDVLKHRYRKFTPKGPVPVSLEEQWAVSKERLDSLEGDLAAQKVVLEEIHRPGSGLRTAVLQSEGEYSVNLLNRIRRQLVGYLSDEQKEFAEVAGVSQLFYALQWIDIHGVFTHESIYAKHAGVQINRKEN